MILYNSQLKILKLLKSKRLMKLQKKQLLRLKLLKSKKTMMMKKWSAKKN
jgi:hypothetical protein